MRSSCLTHPTGRTDNNKCEETISCHFLRLCKASHVYWSKGHVAMNQDGCQNVALCLDPRFLRPLLESSTTLHFISGSSDTHVSAHTMLKRRWRQRNGYFGPSSKDVTLVRIYWQWFATLTIRVVYLHLWSRMTVTWCWSCTDLEIVMCLFQHFRDMSLWSKKKNVFCSV